jgi:formylglycine-generating enzyme required for sulfatase activity
MSQWERLGGPPAAASDTLAPARPLSWNAAAAVLSAGALRFPLHAECLAAAEAGLSTPFWWGGDAARLPELEVVAQTAPVRVGSRGVNPLGFVDLLGNLEEW